MGAENIFGYILIWEATEIYVSINVLDVCWNNEIIIRLLIARKIWNYFDGILNVRYVYNLKRKKNPEK